MSFKEKLFDAALDISKKAAIKAIFDKIFNRYDRPNYDITPGLINIDRTNLIREDIYFDSNGYKLKGYYYPNNSDKLIIICHGLRSGADDYIPFINYFINNGFECFSFNYKGTYESEGDKTFGMSESLVDLDNAIRYINKNYKNKKIYLFGHSWGGFAVCAVLNIHKNIKAVASISGFNDASSIIVDKGVSFGGELAAYPKKYIDWYQEITFGNYLKYNATNGINNSLKTNFLIAHGSFDLIISFKDQSILSKANSFINNNVLYYIGEKENKGHESILYSKEALEYQKIVKREIKLLKGDSLHEYIKNVDHYKYNDVNKELFKRIIDLFNKCA